VYVPQRNEKKKARDIFIKTSMQQD